MDSSASASGITTGLYKKKFLKFLQETKESETILLEGKHEEARTYEVQPAEQQVVVTQEDILDQAPISMIPKKFDIRLPDASFKVDFSRNGKFLCMAGSRGTLRTLNIQTLRPGIDMAVPDVIEDVTFLHQENYIATAQQWLHIYDHQGTELHCFKKIFQPLALEFLPYHMLLVASSAKGFLSYLDITTGDLVAHIGTHRGRLALMRQNPRNGVIFLGHDPGMVTLWTPAGSAKSKPVASMLCHPKRGGVSGLALHPNGNYMATAGLERSIRLWDLRQIGANALHEVLTPGVACTNLCFSASGLLACASDRSVMVLPDICSQPDAELSEAHLRHKFPGGAVTDVQFCPFEDLLACGRFKSVSTILVPGAGAAGLDGLEANPFESKKARREREVRNLMQKIDYNLISATTTVDAVYEGGMLEEAAALEEAVMGPDKSKPKVTKKKKPKRGKGQVLTRAIFEKSAFVGKNVAYKKKRPLSKPATGSVLDTLIPKC